LRTEITIYKGFLECQYSDVKKQSLGPAYKTSKLKLEPRFKLRDAEIVDVFPINELPSNSSFIYETGESYPVECFFKSKAVEPCRYEASELLLVLSTEEFQTYETAQVDFESVLTENDTTANKDNFLSSTVDIQHGKISGIGYCKVVRTFDEKNLEIKQNPTTGIEYTGLENNSGCLSILTAIFAPFFSIVFGINNWIKQLINRFSSRVFNKNLINDNPPNAGCFNAMLPTGCSSSGCSQFGCGCLSLLLALAFLFWFVWCLLLGKCQHETQNTAPDTKTIHDTVYVEVNKAKIDTIVKKDTIIYVDKTTKTKISVVSLPKVQFEQAKAKLLESSKDDLDKLAKDLLSNKQVKAEIIGHTDNSGEAETNLKLSQERAESVRQYLIKAGVDGKRIKATGKGETEPKTSNESAEGRAMNRRVEVKLSQTDKVVESKKRVKQQAK
jgi:outer membrane protein OmpA-like peptidoglycan-associated protein